MNQAHTALLERITSDDPRASEAVGKLTATLHALGELADANLDSCEDAELALEIKAEIEFATTQAEVLRHYFAQLWR